MRTSETSEATAGAGPAEDECKAVAVLKAAATSVASAEGPSSLTGGPCSRAQGRGARRGAQEKPMAREGAASSCQTSNLVFAILALTPRPGLGCPSAPPRSRLRFSRPDGPRITRQLFRDCPSDYRRGTDRRSDVRWGRARPPAARVPTPCAVRIPPRRRVRPRPRDHGGASSLSRRFFSLILKKFHSGTESLRWPFPRGTSCSGLSRRPHPTVCFSL